MKAPKYRPRQYWPKPSPYTEKKPVTIRLSKEARDILDSAARMAQTNMTEIVERIARKYAAMLPDRLPSHTPTLDTQAQLDIANAKLERIRAILDEQLP